MYITKIEIDGFKSYGQYQCLDKFDTQFNAITGLNGSGKSNILDSICFLLGINHLQYIRAENNEELIFKKGQGGITRAMVTITFDNSDPKHCPIGYETEKTIVVRRQIVLNGKQSYHINGLPSSSSKVSDLFNSCSMNVNNPHFLIMQGRVTKVLNMKPREILLMLEEAAGVGLYENKRRFAMNTIEKKQLKIENMGRMMDEEILPRLNKLRGERELYQEYLKLGREIEQQERLQHCFEFWRTENSGKRYREALAARISENEESKAAVATLEQEVKTEQQTLAEMQFHFDNELTTKQSEINEIKKQKETALLEKRSNLKKKEDDVKEIKNKIDTQKRNIEQDKKRLVEKKQELEHVQSTHGGDAKKLETAKHQQEQCKATLAALERGLITDDDGNEVSLQEQILTLKSKLNQEETKAMRFQSACDDVRANMNKAKQEYDTIANRRSSTTLDLKLQKTKEEIENLEREASEYENVGHERDTLSSERKATLSQLRQQQDKAEDLRHKFPFLKFNYNHNIRNFNDDDVIGPFAKLVHPKSPRYITALEIALGGILTNVVVRTREAAKRLLSDGQLERRVTFIPLDYISYRPFNPLQLKKAVELVGSDNVFRAIDLVEFEESNRPAVEYALGSVLICTGPDSAKKVCFDKGVRARVVTLDGDDYRPDGFLTGGSNQRRASVLSELQTVLTVEEKISELEANMKALDARWAELQIKFNKKADLDEKRNAKEFELREINQQIRIDPTSRLKTQINGFKRELAKNEALLAEVQPIVNDLTKKLKIVEDRQKNEVAYRNEERKKAERGLMEAENTIKKLEQSAANAINQLEIHQLDVETLSKQIESDQKDLEDEKNKMKEQKAELGELKEAYEDLNRQFEQHNRDFDDFMTEYRNYEREIKQKSDQINALTRSIREKKTAEQNFERECRDIRDKAIECEKQASLIERQYSWISDEKQYFNKPGTQYDFQGLTLKDLQSQTKKMKDRREELDRRVNVNAMKSLIEEEERALDLDEKRKGIDKDRELLQKTIFEIDAEKKRELEFACTKISDDFGNIFGTIMPGASAKLQPEDPDDLTQGLQVKVSFNNLWKDSLDELSGGQRSLVALSLILAMLKFNPAPIYILDEVDAALDVSHTANIGTMIKKHFTESQFIIVSLKEGMFNNANVIYRTQFVNGTSKVRTDNRNC